MQDSPSKNAAPKLAFILSTLTLLFALFQASLFTAHATITSSLNELAGASIIAQIRYPVILTPIFIYLTTMLCAYIIFTCWIWFIAQSTGEFFRLRPRLTYSFGLFLWCMACLNLLALNHYYFPSSFFTNIVQEIGLIPANSTRLLMITSTVLALMTGIAYINFFKHARYRKMGSALLIVGLLFVSASIYDTFFTTPTRKAIATRQPNIIIIGLDSLRPDFTGYFGNRTVNTPNMDAFLKSGLTFTNTYTSLARTYPSWVSILTAKHPLHNGARNNLINPAKPLAQDNLARILQHAGYETIYASDEKRYSNITKNFGFDTLIGPQMGANDFLLGGLSDSPVSNLLASSAIGRHFLLFNYGNRAAAITYSPNQFMQQIKSGLLNRSNKPIFLAVHFCLTHWPFTWARDHLQSTDMMPDIYRRSVGMVDKQLGELMQLLRENGLLENSLVILLSDHGTAMGLPNDRIISPQTYMGFKDRIKYIPVTRYSSAPQYSPDRKDYSINTSYGQGNSVLSFTQYHTLLSFKRYGGSLPNTNRNNLTVLADIAPTVLDFLQLPPLKQVDGISLYPYFSGQNPKLTAPRKLFLETGDSFSAIETDKIQVGQVIKHEIGVYEVDPKTGLLHMIEAASNGIVKNKQHAIILGDWLLGHFPGAYNVRLVNSKSNKKEKVPEVYAIPSYYVVMNLKTKQWAIGLDTPFAKSAPTQSLLHQLKEFYPGEIVDKSKTSTS